MAEFSELIGRIYDAALSPALWDDALGHVETFVGAAAAALNSYDRYDRFAWQWQYTRGYDPAYQQIYLEKYLAMNPWIAVVDALAAGESGYASAQPNYAASMQGAFYHEWLEPQRFRDAAVLVIDKTVASIATLVVIRTDDQGLFDAEVVRRLKRLYPHLRRAAGIARIVGAAEARADTLATALDALSAGIFLIDRRRTIAHANKAGTEMLAARSPVRSERGRLEFTAQTGAAALRAALELAPGRANGESRGGSSVLVASDGRRFAAHVMALVGARPSALAIGGAASHVVLVRESFAPNARAVAARRSRRLT